jgi:DNA-binding MurR/RpiR family transcriptional regulator
LTATIFVARLVRDIASIGARVPTKKATPDEPESIKPGDVFEELRRRYDKLTHSQKRIAEYIVENAEAVAFATVDQMAARLEVNPSTIVRFTYRLGLNGFPDLQERMRQMVRGQLSRTADTADGGDVASHLQGTSFGASFRHDLKNLHRTIAGLSADDLGKAVAALVRARRVYVAAGFTSYSLAYFFGLSLNRLRSDVFVVRSGNGLSITPLAEITTDDCVVAFTFPRYAVFTHRFVSWARKNGTTVIAVTDTPISAVGQIADIVLLAAASGTGIENSLVAPMAVVSALLDGAAIAIDKDALDRVASRERLMNEWDTFLLKSDGTE